MKLHDNPYLLFTFIIGVYITSILITILRWHYDKHVYVQMTSKFTHENLVYIFTISSTRNVTSYYSNGHDVYIIILLTSTSVNE